MPGENCAFFGCSTSQKHGIGLFKLPCPRADEGEEMFEDECQRIVAEFNT
jgi:hypothetical protein